MVYTGLFIIIIILLPQITHYINNIIMPTCCAQTSTFFTSVLVIVVDSAVGMATDETLRLARLPVYTSTVVDKIVTHGDNTPLPTTTLHINAQDFFGRFVTQFWPSAFVFY